MIILNESDSKLSRIIQAAAKLPPDKFIAFQSTECRNIGALMEIRIMLQIADMLDMVDVDLTFSRYKEFLMDVWRTVRERGVEIKAN
jgi:hypothetical protein